MTALTSWLKDMAERPISRVLRRLLLGFHQDFVSSGLNVTE